MTAKTTIMTVMLSAALSAGGFTAAAAEERVPENRVIYEVFVRNFSPEGNLKGVEKQIPRLRELGVDVVWLMPVYELGREGKWGPYSSPYAVRDYKAIDPDNGTADDLRSLVKTVHDNGMEIWFDWVGNHTAKDNVWVTTHPEYYGNNFYSPNGWSDVYQLDVNNSAMHEAMIEAMQYWVTEFDIDGYRCDYASGPSEEFWRKATSQVLKEGKRVAWLAEDDVKPELVSKGYFDYNYAWTFHDRLLDQTRGINLDNLRTECAALHSAVDYLGRSRMVYLSNHDVVQDKGGSAARLFGANLKPFTVLEFTVYGMPLLYNGQEIGYDCGRVSLAEKTPVDWNRADASVTALIKKLAGLKHTHPALRTGAQNGAYVNLTTSDNSSVMAYRRSRSDDNVVVLLNFSDTQRTVTLSGDLPAGTLTDVFSGRSAEMKTGTQFTLPAHGYAVYVTTNGTTPVDPDPQEPTDPEEPEDPSADNIQNLYVRDLTGWENTRVYGWADGKTELYGGWPGTGAVGGRVVSGDVYSLFELPASSDSYNFIFSDGGGNQLGDLSLIPDRDRFVTIGTSGAEEEEAPAASRYAIYVEDRTGWSGFSIYAWADKLPEFFGGWPGATSSGTAVLEGKTYKVFPFYDTDRSYNLIFNNSGDGTQYDAVSLVPDRNYYFTAESSRATSVSTCVGAVDPDTADSPARYFTLQGAEIARPVCGVYIERRGGVSRKVIF